MYHHYNGELVDPTSGKNIVDDEEELTLLEKHEQDKPSGENHSDSDDEADLESESNDDFEIEEPHIAFIDTTVGWFSLASKTLERIARQRSLPEEEIKKLVKFFIDWVSGDPKLIIKQEAFLQYGIEYWRKVLEDNNKKNLHNLFFHYMMIYLTALLAPPQKGAKNEVKDFDLSNSKQNIMNSKEISK